MIGCALLLMALGVHAELDFQPGMTEAGWIFKGMDSRCELFQHVPDYGTAVFVQYAGQPQEFHLNAHRDLFLEQPLAVSAESPPWRQNYPHSERLGTTAAVTDNRAIIKEPLATRLLMTLYEGRNPQFSQASWFDAEEQVAVRLSNIAFRDTYQDYVRCRNTLQASSFARLERSSVHFDVDRWELTPATRRRLDVLIAYCKAHPEVERIYIDGHTDNSGTREWNLLLSKKRAESVAHYLAEQGLKKDMLIARYHAERYPIASNDTEQGKARNRRTTVRLEKADGKLARR